MRLDRFTKEEAATRIRAGDKPLLLLAREYGVSTNTLRAWLKESDARLRAAEDARRVATSLTPEQYSAATQRERLLMHALEYSPATIIVTDAEGKIVYANPKFVETTGYGIGEVIGQTPRLFKSGETSATEYGQLWKTILSGKEWRGTFHNRRKNGALYWERASISPVFDANGKISNFMAVKEDVTEFMEADLARRKTTRSLQAIIAALPGALLVVDHRGCIETANPAAEHLFGLSLPQGEHLGNLNLRWLDTDGKPISGNHPLPRVLAGETGDEILHARIGIVPPKGGVRWFDTALRSLCVPEIDKPLALLTFE
jgi:PAS domain S-box-containing protein